jgi:GNAT superfamily N-acetyltransferase
MHDIRIIEEDIEVLAELSAIPIRFMVRSVLELQRVDNGFGGFQLTETPITPYEKDYDEEAGESPQRWAERFNVSNWCVLGAWSGNERIGSAVIATRTAGVHMLESRLDMAVLWDIRVQPDHRGQGIGSRLFRAVKEWCIRRGFSLLKVETQNINVAACRFYAREGCVLGAINTYAYPAHPHETQMLWYLELKQE